MSKKLTILLADDHELLLDGLQLIIEKNIATKKIFRAKNGIEVLDIVKKNKIDILISDIDMPELDGIKTAMKLIETHKSLKIIFLTSFYDIKHIKPLLKLNIKVILDKENIKKEINGAIEAILTGETYYTALIKETVNDILTGKRKTNNRTAIPNLTKREQGLFKYFAKGLTNKEIAKEISLSPATIDSHRTNIYLKFEVNNAAKLIIKALEYGLIE